MVNPSPSQTRLEVGQSKYFIPPQTAFVMSSVKHGMYAFNALGKSFDLVVLDPPWSNRSVRRSTAYRTHENQAEDPFIQTLPILKSHLNADGLVAVWVTNKDAVQTSVVEALLSLDLHLKAEWTWLKITAEGQPVTSIHGVWRQPYETLLVFASAASCKNIPRKILLAVPDVHSRKPSLKRLFEQLLPLRYEALELFARSLTAGWWSWGDQVLKFQDVDQWAE